MPDAPAPVDVLSKYFRAFADQTRLNILDLLAERERSVSELVAATGQSQPNVSNHLACLRWCGFVTAERRGKRVFYRVANSGVTDVIALTRTLLDGNPAHVEQFGLARVAAAAS